MKLAILSICQDCVGVDETVRTFLFDVPQSQQDLINECTNLKSEMGFLGNDELPVSEKGVIYELNEEFRRMFPLITNLKESLFSYTDYEVDLDALIEGNVADFCFRFIL